MRRELTHGSGAKTFINSHGQLIHITLDGQYHLLAEGLDLSIKQLEEVVVAINQQEGRWDHPTVMAKVRSLQSSVPIPPAPSAPEISPASTSSLPESEDQSQTGSGETETLKQQLA